MLFKTPEADNSVLSTGSASFSAMGVRSASSNPQRSRLASGIRALDDFLEGGLPVGAVSEWGVPLGRGGREVIMPWLARVTRPESSGTLPAWVLWVYSRLQLTVYPPAWRARGVTLEKIRFACTASPLEELRPVFMEPMFRVIVLDMPRRFSDDDCAFVARQARANGQLVLVLRDYFLSAKHGNVWARLRLNCWHEPVAGCYRLRVVRGLSSRQLDLSVDWLRDEFRPGR